MTADQSSAIFGAGIVIALVVAIGFVARATRRNRTGDANPYDEIARIEQRSDFTFGGICAVLLMIAHNALMAFGYLLGAKSAVQEASIGTIWIAGNVLWGVCMIVGRKHSYRVYRDQPPPERTEPRA